MKHRRKGDTEDSAPHKVFCLKVPIRLDAKWQQDRMNSVFDCSNNVKNALISQKKKALRNMERTKAWKKIQEQLHECYAAMEKADEKDLPVLQEQQNALFEQRNAIVAQYGLQKSDFEKAVVPIRQHYKSRVCAHVAANIATDVGRMFSDYLFGKGKEIRFSKNSEFQHISAKEKSSGIVFSPESKTLTFTYRRKKHNFSVRVEFSENDPYEYQKKAMAHDLRYCGVSRRWFPDGWHYFAEFILDGEPPEKCKEDGAPLHPVGTGRIGLDIGTQTVAVVSDTKVELDVLAEKIPDIQREIYIINRAMDRSTRATNPQMFNKDGTIVPINKLPPECVEKRHGKLVRKWIRRKRYRRLAAKKRYLLSKQALIRQQCHNELANHILTLGHNVFVEDMNFRALAKRSRKTEKSPTTGRYKRKKRFGKSIGNRAPGLFLSTLGKKLRQHKGHLTKIETAKARASQYNHETETYTKKPLSQRWNTMKDGSKIQRDLYSAFLIQNVKLTLDSFNQKNLEKKYPNFKSLHDKEIQRLFSLKARKNMPSSMGIRKAKA